MITGSLTSRDDLPLQLSFWAAQVVTAKIEFNIGHDRMFATSQA
jgi:hypothetical protein